MSKKDKILKKAKDSPENLTFNEMCSLTEHAGFEFRNQTGSHKIFKHPTIKKMLNLQPDKNDKSKAKKYQIKQLVSYIEDFNLMED
ncbi:MAG: type II toxin-antitoxin system HicA family toxin [Candidatus Lokiarchaeota archaeon]|nr:type II toxin-antitoxin system HicA family toxin [Candidatus Lokiarchaeota archaeon]